MDVTKSKDGDVTHHDIGNVAVRDAIRNANRKLLEVGARISAVEYVLRDSLRRKTLRDWTPDLSIIDGELAEIVELKVLSKRLDRVLAELEHLQYRATPLDAA